MEDQTPRTAKPGEGKTFSIIQFLAPPNPNLEPIQVEPIPDRYLISELKHLGEEIEN